MNKKNIHSILFAKKFLNKKGLELFKKNYEDKLDNNFRNFIYTAFFSLFLIFFFSIGPKILSYKNNLIVTSVEVNNNSKSKLEKILNKKEKKIESNENQEIDNFQVFEDIFQYEEIPSSSVRLSASTIKQLFNDTNFSLKNIRETKLVKPITLELLPKEMKMIESSIERKNLFISIVLPLILEENNKIILDRKKLFTVLNKNNNSEAEKKWLNMKFKQYGVKNRDLSTLKVRMDIVPASLAIAQAAKETGWGTSRFAQEGNALFGQWTFSGKGLKPLAIDSDKSHKVMKFQILQASVRAYQRNLNTHSSYRKFRKIRAEARDNNEKLDSFILADCLDQYAATGKEYTEVLKEIIRQNSLKDFDNVKLMPTSEKLKNLI